MLLPSILQILAGDHVQSNVVKSVESGFKEEFAAAIEGESGSEKTETQSFDADNLIKSSDLAPIFQEKPTAGQDLEKLLRIINKFQKPNPQRVVDVFE